jgi:hypothetical protein
MKLINTFFILTLLFTSINQASAYQLHRGDLAYAEDYSFSEIVMNLYHTSDEPDAFPENTVLRGDLIEHRLKRRLSRDEIRKFRLTEAVLPSGEIVEIDKVIKVRPINELGAWKYIVGTGISGVAGAFGLAYGTFTIGLPASRAGIALWGAANYAYEAPHGYSRWAEAFEGFVRGGLFPFPTAIMFGDPLYICPNSSLIISENEDDEEEYINVGLVKRENFKEFEDVARGKLGRDNNDKRSVFYDDFVRVENYN